MQQIFDLRDCSEFFDTVADRVWRAWWQPNGYELETVSTALQEMMAGKRIPFALVARDGQEFLGSTLGIECDLPERPQYSPWVAAVWVEPQHRRKTVGRTLVGRAVQYCFDRGFRRVYLCSSPERWAFYTKQGWKPIEDAVGAENQTVYVQESRSFDQPAG